ncbi:MAG: glycosyltransferase family 2 protein [Deltaproteobacteria bacterium]|nr:glycosyltransferase family 2 protein [Deltaproteobacteria bacterium]
MSVVSVIIPTFNRAQKVTKAVSSVLYQNFRDYEIIVVDDGSTDNTSAVLSQFGNSIKVIAHTENLGVSAARNAGLRSSTAPFVAFLDSDDYWLPGKLRSQLEFFEKNPEALACQTEEIWIRRGRRVNPKKEHLKPSGDIFVPALGRCVVSPSAVMLRRELLHEVGLFDERLPACEDYDLWLRIGWKYPIYLVKQYLVVKEGGAPDQLSAKFDAMDRYRIYSLVKLIRSGVLAPKQLEEAIKELSRKCRIYGGGCVKRGKIEEGNFCLQLPSRVNSNKDFLDTLAFLSHPNA